MRRCWYLLLLWRTRWLVTQNHLGRLVGKLFGKRKEGWWRRLWKNTWQAIGRTICPSYDVAGEGWRGGTTNTTTTTSQSLRSFQRWLACHCHSHFSPFTHNSSLTGLWLLWTNVNKKLRGQWSGFSSALCWWCVQFTLEVGALNVVTKTKLNQLLAPGSHCVKST